MKQRVLITGAAGFLGSHLADLLLARGHAVVGVDNLSQGSLDNLEEAMQQPDFSFHAIDVRDPAAMREAARGVDAIAHLAAFKIPRYGNAIQTLLINAEGTRNALQCAVDNHARFLLASTSDVYGKNPAIPFTEESDCVLGPSTVARWGYATSKLYDEHLTLAHAESYGITANIVRIFGSYGPRQNLTWWGGPQSVFIQAVLAGEPVPIHGDGQQTRSFTYVSDTVTGLAAALDSPTSSEIFNIGSDHEVTVVELAQIIHQLARVPGPLQLHYIPYQEISGKRYEDVRRRVPDTTKARTVLGFEARVSMVEGLARTIAWQRALPQTAPAAELSSR